jgi:hypothetical protein
LQKPIPDVQIEMCNFEKNSVRGVIEMGATSGFCVCQQADRKNAKFVKLKDLI